MINKRFFESKKTSSDRSELFIAESHESFNRASAVLQEFTEEA